MRYGRKFTILPNGTKLMFYLDPARIQPTVNQVVVKDTATFFCFTNKSIHWTLNNGKLPLNAQVLGNKLIITNVGLSDAGKYECDSKTDNDNTFYAHGILKVNSKFILKLNFLREMFCCS